MKVRDVMTREVVSVAPSARLKDLAALLVEHRISGLPVVDDDGAVVGVVSEADLLVRQLGNVSSRHGPLSWLLDDRPDASELRRRAATTVAQAMTSPATTVDADRPLREAAALMVERGINRLPVTEGGQLVGIITRADFVRAYLQRDQEILHAIRDNVIRRTMWLDPDDLNVEVREGIVRIAGRVDRRSAATILEKLIGVVDGVVDVDSYLTWEIDDTVFEPVTESEPEPGAASLLTRERPRQMHG
jgi:CBS domain-containing protein